MNACQRITAPVIRPVLNPRSHHLRFTSTSGFWLHWVEVFFDIITRQAIRRGASTLVKAVMTAIR